MLFDDLAKNSDRFFQEILTFIGVDHNFEPDKERVYHKGSLKPSKFMKTFDKTLQANQNIKAFLKSILKPIYPQIKKVFDRFAHPPVPPLSSQLRAKLIEIYRDDIVQLQELTGLDFSHWLSNTSKIPSR